VPQAVATSNCHKRSVWRFRFIMLGKHSARPHENHTDSVMAVWVTVVGIKIIVHELSFINWMLADNGPGAVWFTEFLNNTMVRSDGIGAETRSVWRHFLRL
jgi:hypothetical protein